MGELVCGVPCMAAHGMLVSQEWLISLPLGLLAQDSRNLEDILVTLRYGFASINSYMRQRRPVEGWWLATLQASFRLHDLYRQAL